MAKDIESGVPVAPSSASPVAVDCPHATTTSAKDKDGKDLTVVRCALVKGFLGWDHGTSPQLCSLCIADPFAPRTLGAQGPQKMVRRLLLTRIDTFAGWDKNPQQAGRFRDNLETAVVKCRAINGEKLTVAALAKGIENGKLTVSEAESLALKAKIKLD